MSKVLESHGYDVLSTDLVDYGYVKAGVDFLKYEGSFDGDIITNPPYLYDLEFVEKAIKTIREGKRVAMLLRLNFLESKKRRLLFDRFPPEKVYVSSSRITCAKNGDFKKHNASNCCAIAFAWFIWKKGTTDRTIIKWFN